MEKSLYKLLGLRMRKIHATHYASPSRRFDLLLSHKQASEIAYTEINGVAAILYLKGIK